MRCIWFRPGHYQSSSFEAGRVEMLLNVKAMIDLHAQFRIWDGMSRLVMEFREEES